MQLKYRFPLYFSVVISVLLAIVMVVIYYLFADFRESDFKSRLAKKVETTSRLLIEVKEVDSTLLTIIDKASTDKLVEETVQIYDDQMKLLYRSGDKELDPLTAREVQTVKKTGQVFLNDKGSDIFGLHYQFSNKDYYVFISAQDKYGIRKLDYLKVLLLVSYIAAIVLIWLLSFYISNRTLRSLLRITRQIQDINARNRKIDVSELKQEDEIKALASSFNTMMERIDEAYKSQQEFTSNAAHELRTPVARMSAQLENLVKANVCPPQAQETIQSVIHDTHQLSDIISSLLLLSKIEINDGPNAFSTVRIDEALFAARAQLMKTYPDFKFHFAIENASVSETSMEVRGDETLLVIAFLNVLRNAYAYSDNQSVYCTLQQADDRFEVRITNSGETPKTEHTRELFTTFKRGTNSGNKPGSGIGLSIVQRILQYHEATLTYNTPNHNTNEIIICFWR